MRATVSHRRSWMDRLSPPPAACKVKSLRGTMASPEGFPGAGRSPRLLRETAHARNFSFLKKRCHTTASSSRYKTGCEMTPRNTPTGNVGAEVWGQTVPTWGPAPAVTILGRASLGSSFSLSVLWCVTVNRQCLLHRLFT